MCAEYNDHGDEIAPSAQQEADPDQNPLQAADEEIGIAMLIKGEIDNRPFWAYVSVFPSKYDEFMQIYQSGAPYILTDYADIIRHGLDQTDPPAAIATQMETEYGLDHNFEDNLAKITQSMIRDIQKLSDDG